MSWNFQKTEMSKSLEELVKEFSSVKLQPFSQKNKLLQGHILTIFSKFKEQLFHKENLKRAASNCSNLSHQCEMYSKSTIETPKRPTKWQWPTKVFYVKLDYISIFALVSIFHFDNVVESLDRAAEATA